MQMSVLLFVAFNLLSLHIYLVLKLRQLLFELFLQRVGIFVIIEQKVTSLDVVLELLMKMFYLALVLVINLQ